MYQHDAACRVILRLQKERDEAREALSKVSIDGVPQPPAGGDSMQVDSSNLPAPIADKIIQFRDEYAPSLFSTPGINRFRAKAKRKKRKIPPTYTTIDSLREIHLLSRGQKIATLFTSIALDPESQYNLAVFGPRGGLNSIIYDLANHEWKGQLSDEQGDIVDVEWYNRGPVTAGSMGSISIWSPTGSIKFKLQAHEYSIVGIDLHPFGDLLASAAKNGEWAIHDLVAETTVVKFKDDAGTPPPTGLRGVVLTCFSVLLFGFTSRWTRLSHGLRRWNNSSLRYSHRSM